MSFKKILIYDNFIGLRCLTSLLLEIDSTFKINCFSNNDSINFNSFEYDDDFLNIIYINSFDSYPVKLIESKKICNNIVIVTEIPVNIYFHRFSKYNVIGYIDRNSISENTFINLFQKIHERKIYISEDDRDILLGMNFDKTISNSKSEIISKLSLQEYNVMTNLLAGKSINEIANDLNLHKSSISTYKKRIFSKLSVKNIFELNLFIKKDL